MHDLTERLLHVRSNLTALRRQHAQLDTRLSDFFLGVAAAANSRPGAGLLGLVGHLGELQDMHRRGVVVFERNKRLLQLRAVRPSRRWWARTSEEEGERGDGPTVVLLFGRTTPKGMASQVGLATDRLRDTFRAMDQGDAIDYSEHYYQAGT
jgi:hypothetical protein